MIWSAFVLCGRFSRLDTGSSVWYKRVMVSKSMNRIEILFRTTIDKMKWVAGNIRVPKDGIQSQGVSFTEHVTDVLGKSTILNIEEGDGGSLVVYFEGCCVPSCWFTSMVKADKTIVRATMEYTEPSNLVVGNVHWDHARKTITEEYREGANLTDDDFYLLGRIKCTDCGRFQCECWIEEKQIW